MNKPDHARSTPPPWFASVLGKAIAEDTFNALTPEQKNEVEASLASQGIPPAWFIEKLK